MIVEIEGIDGAGKTLQCRLLKNWFEKTLGQRAIVVKDLESTSIGRQIKEFLITDTPRTKEVELFAFLFCKSSLMSEVIAKEIERKTHIICDRGIGSFLSYFQINGFNCSFLEMLLSKAILKSYKATTIILDLEVDVAMSRNANKPSHSKYDGMGSEFFEQQRRALLELGSHRQWKIVDGGHDIQLVHSSIVEIAQNQINAES